MMKRKRRTEILIHANPELAKNVAEAIATNTDWKEIVSPRHGLTMVKVRETAKNSLFYLGEVLVTEAKIEIEDHIGIGIVKGMEDELARNLAIIDAAYQAGRPEIENWEPELMEAEEEIRKERAKKQAEIYQTKVHFETMDES